MAIDSYVGKSPLKWFESKQIQDDFWGVWFEEITKLTLIIWKDRPEQTV